MDCELVGDDRGRLAGGGHEDRPGRPAHYPAGWALMICLAFAGMIWALVIMAFLS